MGSSSPISYSDTSDYIFGPGTSFHLGLFNQKKESTPRFDMNAAKKEQNRINQAVANQYYADVNSPLGGYSVSVNPDTGQMTINKSLNKNSELAQQIQGDYLSQYNADPRMAQDAYYNRQMQYVNPTFARQVANAQESLANRGVQMGSNTWNNTMNSVYGAQDKANTAMLNNALLNGQQYQSNLLNQAASAGNLVYDPSLIEGQQGAGMEDLYQKQFENQTARWKSGIANNNKAANWLGTAGGIAGGILGGIFLGPGGAQMGAQGGTSAGSGLGGLLDNA